MTETEAHNIVVSFADLPTIVGRSFCGEWWSVGRDRLELFDRAAYVDSNEYPLELSGYPDGLIEGFHGLSLLDHMTNPVVRITDPGVFGWNYGFDRVRFVSPMTVEDQIRVAGRIQDVRPKDDGFVVTYDLTVEVKGRDRPGLAAVWMVFWLPTSPVASGDQTASDEEGTAG